MMMAAELSGQVPALALSVLSAASDRAVVSMRGELDIATVDHLSDYVRDIVKKGLSRLVLSLSGLTFCDCSGLTALEDLTAEANAAGCRLILAAPQPSVAKLLHLTQFDHRLTVLESLDLS